jgi:hypothetical protein
LELDSFSDKRRAFGGGRLVAGIFYLFWIVEIKIITRAKHVLSLIEGHAKLAK